MVMMNSCNVMTQQKILHGFVEVLDTPCPEGDVPDDDGICSSASGLAMGFGKIGICAFLLKSLKRLHTLKQGYTTCSLR